MNPTNKQPSVKLDGKAYKLFFDLNTFDKFEEISGKHFLEFLASLQEALAVIKPAGQTQDMFGFLRKLSIRDLRAFVYAALHDYDKNGEPVWPLTIGQMGRLVTTETIPQIISLVMRGTQENTPSPDDVEGQGDTTGGVSDHPFVGEKNTTGDGGPSFGPSDASILDSLTKTSDD